jgi:hypothetical protein
VRERILRITIPVVAVVVASFQLYQARAHDQVAWEGGGFGMFATIDAADNRVIISSPPVRLSDSPSVQRALAHPRYLDDLARLIAAGIDRAVTVELAEIVYGDLDVSYRVVARVEETP